MRRAGRVARFLAAASRQGPLASLLGPRLRLGTRHYSIELPGVTKPLRLAIISDLHFGFAGNNAAHMQMVRARVMATTPDMVLFLGDIAGGWPWVDKTDRITAGCAALSGFDAPLGCFAVLGNHDWTDDADAKARKSGPNRATALLQDQGWCVLENAAQPIDADTTSLWIAGIASQRAFRSGLPFMHQYHRLDDLPKTLSQVPADAPLLLMAHEPDIFTELPNRPVLTVSGHTHGGQIRVAGRAVVTPSRYGTRFAHGHFNKDHRHLIVSGGLGCSTIPLRIGMVPEITLVTISG